jgi:hypothetical protein
MSAIWSIQNLTWALAGFFSLGFVINTFAVKMVDPDYQRWGYPHWFHFVTGGFELLVALLLPATATRPLGLALGCAVMLAAAATVIHHGEYPRAAAPLIVLVLLGIVGWTMLQA